MAFPRVAKVLCWVGGTWLALTVFLFHDRIRYLQVFHERSYWQMTALVKWEPYVLHTICAVILLTAGIWIKCSAKDY